MSKTAFIFPGQGSQSIGMLSDLAERYPLVIDEFNAISMAVGYDVWDLIQSGPIEKLNQTEHTQVAMLAADVAIFQIIKTYAHQSIHMMAGHSLGEYAALVCSGAIDSVSAAQLVAQRGRLMQETVPFGQGAMAAIVGLSDDVVLNLCESVNSDTSVVTPANYNAIGQVVIAGHTEAVKTVLQQAEVAGARLATLIPVSVPCHCPLLYDAAMQFEAFLEAAPFKVPDIPVMSNVDLTYYTSVGQMKSLLKAQLYSPVRWVETIQRMANAEITDLIECGPGQVLAGLVKRIDRSLNVTSVNSLERFMGLLEVA